MNTALQPMYEWKNIPWRKLEKNVFKLQRRIYQASNRGDVKTVHRLQRLLMKSWSAKCLAVRRVTQDNQGKKTAGVDGVKSLTPKQRLTLVSSLEINQKVNPTRRVRIPKPGSAEKRPLGIPTMNDRALQAIAKIALEPEWEAKFEENSYGFRPGRSCHDAVAAIFNSIRFVPKYALAADISKCFDQINHEALLRKIGTFPKLRRVIKAWLKSGVVDNGTLFPTEEGTPQGGVISPLLANIALHGLETRIRENYPEFTKVNGIRYTNGSWKPEIIRYADDFVILHRDLSVIQECKRITEEWLKDMGLELKPSKTRIAHTLEKVEGIAGFEFLGFNICQHKAGKHNSAKNPRKQILGFKTIITPTKEKAKRHYKKLVEIIEAHTALPQNLLIQKLNPVIRGWCNYYSTVVSQETFDTVAHLLFKRLLVWACRRHPRKGKKWVVRKYWQTHWNFKSPDGWELANPAKTSIKRHVKVKGNSSPYDGNWVYWATRKGEHPETPTKVATLLKKQKGKCPCCGLFFKTDDLLEIDHITPKSLGGKDEYKNWQLLHRHCHDKKTSEDGSINAKDVWYL
ncbi:group II intron reverse transcriptase/maturase [Dolichospermum heterosporum]|uniref:Group II intron reverse transcriptase/maturase n=1 Tax=Dolichospermum heterosporum TAC447 TaxID=747523 RepID=A0ABY5M1L7_9CYAN|nr:group II intron reverse transcriptase/maturase [Dolichospermum heterosporum]UUO16666.1 group II intron reverse transcriptase/maturase [Dolichospermum heterosporum TAC447]